MSKQRPTRESATEYFRERGMTLLEFELTTDYAPLKARWDALVYNPRYDSIEVWSWDAFHGNGFWHLTEFDGSAQRLLTT